MFFKADDCVIDVYGPNRTVRVTHKPTGLFAEKEGERSEWMNIQMAKRDLQNRVDKYSPLIDGGAPIHCECKVCKELRGEIKPLIEFANTQTVAPFKFESKPGSIAADKPYGCSNEDRPTFTTTSPVQTGWEYSPGYNVLTRMPVIEQRNHVMSTECMYDRSATDQRCKGCCHAKT